ncbi:LacI family DNA-binding transcriptional regulator [Paremcibacter congregatus]|uniref:LacI family DNA-binding transcriptional regulator n=1 Tax=Paremcibacter congregatus TaxID=2043170 RepID=UPI0030EF6F9B|tara:strand:+ start:779 stop:1780 length:1002 start_codon:yes stop_codon:yes gene_type:complete
MTTIQEVSKLAGVSVATVSRTLSMPDKVSPKTREKVHAAIAKTNYRPNVLARNFRTRKALAIVVLVPDIANSFFSRVIRGIEQAAQKKGYSVLLGDTQGLAEREYTYANMVKTSQADGIIQLHAHIPFENEADLSLPLVNACDCVRDAGIPTVQLDNAAAAKSMTEHLISLGHTRIAAIQGPSDSPITQDRLRGYQEALRENNLEVDTSLVGTGDFSLASGEAAARGLMTHPSRPTALFCFSDEMAFGAIHHIKSLGLSVPGDISVAGFDDISFAAYCDPPLTTISQPAEEFGTMAMSMLYDIINHAPPESLTHYLPHKLICRQSSGPVNPAR